MSFENEGKDEDDSDTLNDSDNIDSQHGSSNKGRKLPFNFDQIIARVILKPLPIIMKTVDE